MLRDMNADGEFGEDELFFYAKDHLNSVHTLTDKNGVPLQRYNYTAYGKTKIEKTNPSMKFIKNPYAYTSREWEEETGDYYYRARYYDPGTGRFLSEDPIGFNGQDANLYRYGYGQPIRFTDPTGEVGLLGIVGIGGVVGGFSGALGAYIGGERNLCNIADAAIGGAISGVVTVGTTLGTIAGGVGTGSAVFTGIIFGSGASAIGNAISPFSNSDLCTPCENE